MLDVLSYLVLMCPHFLKSWLWSVHEMVSPTFIQRIFLTKFTFFMFFLEVEFSIQIKIYKKCYIFKDKKAVFTIYFFSSSVWYVLLRPRVAANVLGTYNCPACGYWLCWQSHKLLSKNSVSPSAKKRLSRILIWFPSKRQHRKIWRLNFSFWHVRKGKRKLGQS